MIFRSHEKELLFLITNQSNLSQVTPQIFVRLTQQYVGTHFNIFFEIQR